MGPWDLVIFDLDGTLTDSRRAIVGAARAALEDQGLPAPGEQAVLDLVGLPLTDVIGALLPADAQDLLPAAVQRYRETYVDLCRATTALFPGVEALLDDLGGVPLAVATGKSLSGAERVLGELGLRERFRAVVAHDSVERPKPWPDMVHAVWATVPAAPSRTVVVGDTTYDIEMGRAAGAATCAVTWGNHDAERLQSAGPERTVHDVAGLAGVLGLA